MATITDVARLAGVSVSTVSYVVSGTRPISVSTSRKVRAAMDELGYQPNAFARGLASRRTRTLGLMFPTPERGLGVTELEFITSAAQACRRAKYQMVLWTTQIHESAELKALTGSGLVDGVIVMEVRLVDERVDLDASLITDQRKRAVGRILDSLPAKDRDVLRMVFLEEADRQEVSRRLGVSAEYLRVLLHRAKSRFEEEFTRTRGDFLRSLSFIVFASA